MKIYTRTGDKGQTGLYGADRVSKAHPRVEAYGTVDELNSLLGVVRSHNSDDSLDADVAHLQNALFDVGADLATRDDSPYRKNIAAIDAEDVTHVEDMIDRYQSQCPELTQFIHPAGTVVSAHLHHARAVARRAERQVVLLSEQESTNPHVQKYLNRLSDLLFVMARAANARAGISEDVWHVKKRKQ